MENEDDVRKLRKKARELMKEMLEKQRHVPIRWEQFESKLTEKVVNERVPYMFLKDVHALGEGCGVKDVKAAINFLHHQGVVLHNVGSPVVVLNPVWLMNIFAEIITVPQEDIPRDAGHRALLEEGILMEEYLTKREHGEIVKMLLLEFGLICPWKYEGRPAFVVPSLTPVMQKGDEVEEILAKSPIAPLYLHFRQGHMLPGFFTRFLGLVINTNSRLLSFQPRLYCNYAMLYFDDHEVEFDVYLVEQLVGIQIGVVPRSEVKDEKFIEYLKKSITECIDNLKKNEGLYRNINVDLKVKCTVCFGEKTTCVLHRKDSCNHDSCAHYWTLPELQQCTKDPVCRFSSDVTPKIFPRTPVLSWLNSERTSTNCQSTPSKTSHEDVTSDSVVEGSGDDQEKYKLGFAGKGDSEIGSEQSKHAETNAEKIIGNLDADGSSLWKKVKADSARKAREKSCSKRIIGNLDADESKIRKKVKADSTRKAREKSCSKRIIGNLDPDGSKIRKKVKADSASKAREESRSNYQSLKKLHISQLHCQKEKEICKKLDIKEEFGGDFEELAAHFKMPQGELDFLYKNPNPTQTVLQWAAKLEENTIETLCKVLGTMGRFDCIHILRKDKHEQEVNLPLMEQNVSELGPLTQQGICQILNVEMDIAEDYKCLAEKFEMPNVVLNIIVQNPNPTGCILRWAGRKRENTIGKLYGILKKMGRDDCTNVIDALKKDLQHATPNTQLSARDRRC